MKSHFFLVELPVCFPVDQPELLFQSVYHETPQEKPFCEIHQKYPYSPRWSPMEMAERTK